MIAKWLIDSRYTVVFSGAGMSTESGVPDFRSKNGLWQGKGPQKLASTEALVHNKEEFVDFYRMRIESLQDIKPHAGYEVLTKWGTQLHLKSIITQNTDGLHELAGNLNVIPIHGTIRKMHCNSCRTEYPSDRYANNHLYCTCKGFIRPSVVLFGESLDSGKLAAAENEALKADLFIVLGSSLVVSPANHYPIMAKENGANLVIVNHDATPLDAIADAVIHDMKIGAFLQDVSSKVPLN